ncbi:MAG: hypothetical protein ACR2IP_07975, partial [Solirubrobacteraceae bacterium]
NQRQTVLKPVASNAPHNSGPGSDTSQPADDQPRSPIDTILLACSRCRRIVRARPTTFNAIQMCALP